MYYIIIVILILLTGCNVDIQQIPYTGKPGNLYSVKPAVSNTLYLKRFVVYSSKTKDFDRALTMTFRSILNEKRVFEQVIIDADKVHNAGEYELFVEFWPIYHENINWWISWPGVMYTFWPYQLRHSHYSVTIKYILYKKGMPVKHGSVNWDSFIKIKLYGISSIISVEEMIELANLEVLNLCADDLKSFFESLELNPL